jgi:hypothetical protein
MRAGRNAGIAHDARLDADRSATRPKRARVKSDGRAKDDDGGDGERHRNASDRAMPEKAEGFRHA